MKALTFQFPTKSRYLRRISFLKLTEIKFAIGSSRLTWTEVLETLFLHALASSVITTRSTKHRSVVLSARTSGSHALSLVTHWSAHSQSPAMSAVWAPFAICGTISSLAPSTARGVILCRRRTEWCQPDELTAHFYVDFTTSHISSSTLAPSIRSFRRSTISLIFRTDTSLEELRDRSRPRKD